jgi:hypothetical protein
MLKYRRLPTIAGATLCRDLSGSYNTSPPPKCIKNGGGSRGLLTHVLRSAISLEVEVAYAANWRCLPLRGEVE